MAESTDDFVDLNGTVCEENEVHDNVSLNAEATTFGRVFRLGLVGDAGRRVGWTAGSSLLLGSFRGVRGVAESACDDAALLATAWRRVGGAVAEASARHRASNSILATGSVAIAFAAGQSGRTEAIGGGGV